MAFPKMSGLVAFACPLLLTGVSAAAESGDEDKERLNAEEEIVVTGSRIHRKDLTTPAPVRVITREQIDQSGRFSFGDFLQLMPEQGNAMNTQVNNHPSLYTGDGSTRISLRSLGENRTLVLVNGRRFISAGFGSADSSGDLNSIPGTAIERIEVLKDGASAIYGSDSMGGVVNIITRRRFNATEVEAFGGVSSHGDGQLLGFSGTTGLSGDRGNALLSASFYGQQSVGAGDRSFSSSGLLYDAVNGVTIPQQGSSNVPQGRFPVPAPGTPVPNPNNDSRIAFYNQLVTTYPEAASFIHDPAAALGWRPFDVAKVTYNFQPENYNQTPSRRIALFSTGDLNVGHRVRAYYEASYVNRQSEQQLAPDVYGTDLDFAVVSSAGTTNTGAVDPLDAIADVCEREGLWHQVDGAYGAFFYLSEDLRDTLRGLPRADSLTLDPHVARRVEGRRGRGDPRAHGPDDSAGPRHGDRLHGARPGPRPGVRAQLPHASSTD